MFNEYVDSAFVLFLSYLLHLLIENGEVYAWGLGEDGQLGDGNNANARGTPVRVALPDDVVIKFISAGHDYSLAVDGTYVIVITMIGRGW